MGYYQITPNLVATTAVNVASFVKLDTANPDAMVQAGIGDTAIGITYPGTNYPPGVPGATTVAASAGQSCAVYGAGSIVEVQVGASTVTPGYVKPDGNGYATQAFPGDYATGQVFVTGVANSFIRCQVLPTGQRAGTIAEATFTTSTTLTGANAGSTIYFGGTANGVVLTLPAASASKGLIFRFVSLNTTDSTGSTVGTTGTDTIIGKAGGTLAGSSGKGATDTHATALAGDSITVQSDGTSTWYILASTGTWAQQS